LRKSIINQSTNSIDQTNKQTNKQTNFTRVGQTSAMPVLRMLKQETGSERPTWTI